MKTLTLDQVGFDCIGEACKLKKFCARNWKYEVRKGNLSETNIELHSFQGICHNHNELRLKVGLSLLDYIEIWKHVSKYYKVTPIDLIRDNNLGLYYEKK